MIKNEYLRIRSNLLSVISRARRDGIDVSGINVPSIPKRITDGSVRRIQKIHEEAKHEIAKRRRIKRRRQQKISELPPRKPRAALDNLETIIEEAITFVDTVHSSDFTRYQDAVNACGNMAHDLIEEMLTENETELYSKYPGHVDAWYSIMAENMLIDAAEEILRTRQSQLEYYLYGFSSDTGGMPNSDPKPIIYAAFRQLMGTPLSGEEFERLITGPFEAEEPFSDGWEE